MWEAVADGVGLMDYTPWGCIGLLSAFTGEMENVMDLFMWKNAMTNQNTGAQA